MACTEGYWATFIIYVTEPAVVASFHAQYPNGLAGVAPSTLALLYGVPIWGRDSTVPVYPGIGFADGAHLTDSDWFVDTSDGGRYPGSCAHVTQLAIMLLGGQTPVPGPPSPIVLNTRNWIDGFEIVGPAESGVTGEYQEINRDASRTSDGFGFAYRAIHNTLRTHALPVPKSTTWERFYIRLRKLPTGSSDNIWSCRGNAEAGAAALINVDTAGRLVFYNKGNDAYPGTQIGIITTPLTLGVWYRLDFQIRFKVTCGIPPVSPPCTPGAMHVYLNGVDKGTFTGGGISSGLNNVTNHINSSIGQDANQGASNGLECDIDDWNNTNTDSIWTPGNDLSSGSHIYGAKPTGFSNNTNWTGDWRYFLGNPQDNSAVIVTSATLNALVGVTTDLQDRQFGIAAVTAAVFVVTNASSFTLSINAASGTIKSSVIPSFGGGTWSSNLYTVPDNTDRAHIPLLAPVNLTFLKAGSTSSIRALLASYEVIGYFGAEDQPGQVFPAFPGLHNAPYPTDSASTGGPPTGAVVATGGLYTGNSFAQDILMQFPAHWWWVRSVTAGPSEGGVWWSSMETSHFWVEKGTQPDPQPQATVGGTTFPAQDPFGAGTTPAVRTMGIDQRVNLNASIYQYVAISDNTMRFIANGAFSHVAALASAVNVLANPAFGVEGAFFMFESIAGLAAVGHFFKGVGHTGNTASPLSTAQVANIATLGAGSITSLASLNDVAPQTAYMAMRSVDAGGSSGFLDLVTWTGNGGGPRTIAVDLGGNRPLFAIASPHTGASITRDPSHTGTNSSIVASGIIANGIVGGGLNQVLIDAALNANGVVYDMFVLAADQTACNGGWGCNGPFPYNPPGGPGPWFPPPAGPNPPFPTPPTPPGPLPPGCISLGTAITELATRLGDLNGVHWTAPELQLYLTEALRVFNGLTHFYKGRETFVTVASQAFYELPVVIPTMRSYNVLDTDLITLTEYALIEPPTPTGWTGTAMFSLNALTQALQRRLDRFRWESGIIVTNIPATSNVIPDFDGRVVLDPSVMTLRRVAWNFGGGLPGPNTTPLLREDTWGMNQYSPNWPSVAPATSMQPWAYSVGETPPLVLQLAPPPSAGGQLDLLAIIRAAVIDPATAPSILEIPDDFCWVIRYGMMADLLKAPGPANDPARGALCDVLYDQGVLAAKRFGVVIDARRDGLVTTINSVNDADSYLRQWQTGTGTPNQVLLAGVNLVALSPVPDSTYTIMFDVVRNIPIPTAANDCFFEGGAGLTQVLLDYAQFCAIFKEGAGQAQEATQLLQRFLTACGIQINIDQATTPTRDATIGQSKQAERVYPRSLPAVDTST